MELAGRWGKTCGAREYVRTMAPRLRPGAPDGIDCDEWRLLWIPDRDRELGGREGGLVGAVFY